MRRVAWEGTSRKDVRDFPPDVRARVGYEIFRLQRGFEPTDWKPMSAVGAGVEEIRIRGGVAYRVIYLARFSEAVYILHAFEKSTQKTTRRDLEIARTRYRELLARRARRHELFSGQKDMMKKQKFAAASSKVFRDVGFTSNEAASLKIRADLMLELAQMIEQKKLTQSAAARLLGVTQPRISNLVRGRIDLFSVDTLIDLISRAGGSIQVTVRKSGKAR